MTLLSKIVSTLWVVAVYVYLFMIVYDPTKNWFVIIVQFAFATTVVPIMTLALISWMFGEEFE